MSLICLRTSFLAAKLGRSTRPALGSCLSLGARYRTSISYGRCEGICNSLPPFFEAKLVHHLPYQVVVGSQERIGYDPEGKVHKLPVLIGGDAVIAMRSLAGNPGTRAAFRRRVTRRNVGRCFGCWPRLSIV